MSDSAPECVHRATCSFNTLDSRTEHGAGAVLDGASVLIGTPTWPAAEGVGLPQLDTDRERLEEKAPTVVAVARDGRVVGLIGIEG